MRDGRLRNLSAALAVVLGLVPGLGVGGANAQQTSDQLFQQLLNNPRDLNLNFNYADLAVQQGDLKKALSVYERILMQDPTNEHARAEYDRLTALMEPANTQYIFALGAEYQQNSLLRSQAVYPNSNGFNDTALSGSLTVLDQRTIGDNRFLTNATFFMNGHHRGHAIDTDVANVESGPLFNLSNGFRLRPFGGTEFVATDEDYRYYALRMGADLDTPGVPLLRSMRLAVERDAFSSDDPGRDATVFMFNALFVRNKIVSESDFFFTVFRPTYNDATAGYASYYEFRIDNGYRTPIVDKLGDLGQISLGVDFNFAYRRYSAVDPIAALPQPFGFNAPLRVDKYFQPGVRLISAQPFDLPGVSAVLQWYFEQNDSTDVSKTYFNHFVGLTLLKAF